MKKTTKQSMKGVHKLKCDTKKHMHEHGSGSMVYFLGFIGAAVYYISNAPTFWTGVLGFLKALVWPAFLVYEVLKFLGV